MYRIYLVEDDETIAGALQRQLEKWGFLVQPAEDFGRIIEEFRAFQPHLVLLDISLPFYDGYYWCGELRRISQTPIIFLSSAGDDLNQVMALSMGADDFIPKPFRMELAVAKIKALLRRTYDFSGDPELLEAGDVALDLRSAELVYGENRLELSRNEFRILQLLMERRGQVVSREALMSRLWETDSFIDDNTLTVNMTRLRRKLADQGLSDFILTKKGMGYLVEDRT